MLYRGVGKRSDAKNEFEIDVRASIWRDVRTLAIEEAYTTKYSIHPGVDPVSSSYFLAHLSLLSPNSSEVHTADQLPLPRYGLDAPPARAGLSDGYDRTIEPSHDSSFASPSRKRSRSPAASVPLSSPIPGALSYARADLLPSPKRIRSYEFATDLEVSLAEGSESSRYRGTDLEMNDDVVRSDGIDIDHEIQAEIDECIAYADSLRDRGINDRVVVEVVDREEIKTGVRGPAIESVQRDQGHRIVATGQQSADMLERIQDLERDNMRLRDMMDVTMTRNLPNTRSGASRTREGVNEQIDRRLAGALGARDAARNLEPLIGDGGEQGEVNGNGGNGNGGNGNGGK
ncbi:hypothetical protein Tco_1577224 [Tanacetum coccineum]